MDAPITDKYDLKYYEKLPPEFRVATFDDFSPYNLYPGKPYLIQSYYTNHYECYRAWEPETLLERILPWLADGKVFVLNKKL